MISSVKESFYDLSVPITDISPEVIEKQRNYQRNLLQIKQNLATKNGREEQIKNKNQIETDPETKTETGIETGIENENEKRKKRNK